MISIINSSLPVYPDLSGARYPEESEFFGLRGIIPLVFDIERPVIISKYSNGIERRRLTTDSPRMTLTVTHTFYHIEEGEIHLVPEMSKDKVFGKWSHFYHSVLGPYKPFIFILPTKLRYYKRFCGTATQDRDDIILPIGGVSPQDSSAEVFVNGQKATYRSIEEHKKTGLLYVSGLGLKAGDKVESSFYGRLAIFARMGASVSGSHGLETKYEQVQVQIVEIEPTLDLFFVE